MLGSDRNRAVKLRIGEGRQIEACEELPLWRARTGNTEDNADHETIILEPGPLRNYALSPVDTFQNGRLVTDSQIAHAILMDPSLTAQVDQHVRVWTDPDASPVDVPIYDDRDDGDEAVLPMFREGPETEMLPEFMIDTIMYEIERNGSPIGYRFDEGAGDEPDRRFGWVVYAKGLTGNLPDRLPFEEPQARRFFEPIVHDHPSMRL